jgi:hypothetical protein
MILKYPRQQFQSDDATKLQCSSSLTAGPVIVPLGATANHQASGLKREHGTDWLGMTDFPAVDDWPKQCNLLLLKLSEKQQV